MHSHDHSHSNDQSSKRIATAFFLNTTFTVIEFVGGWLTNSVAIMADAVHDLGDSLSIGTAWWLNARAGKSATNEFTYGYRRLSLFGALINDPYGSCDKNERTWPNRSRGWPIP